MRFEWDEEKNRRNLLKHGVSFETATLVFDDPFALTQRDQLSEDEQRWITVGAAEHEAVLLWSTSGSIGKARRSLASFPQEKPLRVKGTVMRKLTRQQRQEIAALAAQRDEDIDLSDMPEVIDWSGAEIGKFYRPPKKSVTMRLDEDVLKWLKGFGKGYQTRANLLLRHAMTSATGQRNTKRSRRAP
jgi:uncharacterized DUF497 family protein/uncharacterized protein (DUF4415 family)